MRKHRKAEQKQRAQEIMHIDSPPFVEPTFIGRADVGFEGRADVGFEQEGTATRAAIAILHYPSLPLQLVEYQISRIPTVMLYVSDCSLFRKCPSWSGLLAAVGTIGAEARFAVC
ncbi:MAG: hypothetical protein ACR5K7_04450 [Symbiopectobacterium sp.]